MRNLELLDSIRIADASELEGSQHLSIDYDTKDVYCTNNKAVYIIHPETQQVDIGVSLEDYIAINSNVQVVGLQHLPDQMSLCLALTSGDILLWNCTTEHCECVGSVDSGITAMDWSPDYEVVAIITGANTLLIMTRDFDAVTEVPIQQTGFGEAEFVTVGWGKKETQFHGSVGKQAAVQKADEAKPVFSWDDRKPRISWRGDGQYFVISFINVETGARTLRTWTRDGTLHTTSESVDGVEQALAWRPSGSLIATSQRKPNRHDIIFFERNGLKHGEFTLPFGQSEVKVKEIMWNMESTVLLLWCEEKQPKDESEKENWIPKSWVQMWTVGNYHWYLKQNLEFSATKEDQVSAICWDPEHGYVLHIVCRGGQYLQYQWCWKTHCSGTSMSQVAVIDGDKLLMTPFNQTVVPPPMSAYSIKLPKPAHGVSFNGDEILVQTSDKTTLCYTFNSENDKQGPVKIEACGGTGFTSVCQTPSLSKQWKLEPEDSAEYPLQCYHFYSLDDTRHLYCSLTVMGGTSMVYLCDALKNKDNNSLVIDGSTEVDGRIIAIAYNKETRNVVLEFKDGSLHKLDVDTMTVTQWKNQSGEIIKFSHPCPQMTVCTLGGEEVVIGLTERFRLFVNNIQVATNCTSFALHNEFLLLTTHAHSCRCICRKTKLSNIASLSDGKAHPFDESVRRLERGSRIVCVVPDDTKVVLQMPRGNLETIHPRALVLASVKNHLNRVEFKDAFILMRKHRINMNLLYDHDPELFFNNIQEFITQIDNPTHINLFISELQEEDVTKTMYTATYMRNVTATPATTMENKPVKVNKVCDVLREALIKADYDKFLLSVLTTYVKKTKPELPTALNCVKNLKGLNNKNSRTEEALKYLLFMVDVNELYDVALGTYDFELVIMVAEKSQKDPKEYLPFLNDLRRLEPNYQKYSIDKHLKKYRCALRNIVLCGKDHFSECLELVKEHRLYPEALELHTHDSEEYQSIANAYGEYLNEKKYHEEAGLLFVKAKSFSQAMDQFDKCLDWRNCICVATKLGHNKEQLGELSKGLAKRLKEVRKYSEAALLLEQYAEDPEEAIVTLIEGQLWDEALRTMYKYKREDFIETDLKPGLQEAQEQQLLMIQEQRAVFEKRYNRLAVVRANKEKKRLELIEGGGEYSRADADLYSDTSSATGDSVVSDDTRSRGGQSRKSGSIYTKVSGSSRKARRKAEQKKRWTLKEGSLHEDYAIVESLALIIKQMDSIRGDIASLLKALVQFNYEKQAQQLQVEYDSILILMNKSLSDIWDPIQQENSTVPTSFGPDSTANTIALAMQQGLRISTTEDQLEPVLRAPPSISKDNSWKLNLLTRTREEM